jgi:hypothetical protein
MDDDHYSVIHYGTDPNDLSQTAKNHIRLNQTHPETIFRVRVIGIKPATTYYYKRISMGYDGVSDGLESSVNHFTTAAPGQMTSASRRPSNGLRRRSAWITRASSSSASKRCAPRGGIASSPISSSAAGGVRAPSTTASSPRSQPQTERRRHPMQTLIWAALFRNSSRTHLVDPIGNYRHQQERAEMALVRDRALDGVADGEVERKLLPSRSIGLKVHPHNTAS